MWRERLILPWQPITFAQTRNLKSLIFPEHHLDSVIRLGEVEHLQVIACQAGWQASEDLETQADPSHQPPTSPSWLTLQNRIDSLDGKAGSAPTWAKDKTYGFLQSDPAWAGCGLQIEAVVHLPAMTMHRRLAQAHEGLQALGLLLHPEPMGTMSGQDAGYFRISSRGGLGQTAESLNLTFWKNLKPLLQWEADLREMWWRRDGLLLRDRIRRSLRMLSEAQLLPLHEAIGFVSYVRLGALLGEIESGWLIPAEKVRVLSQSAHLGFASPPMPDTDKAEWQKRQDAARAEKVRTLWKQPG
jgi:protein-arginine kinase